MLKRKKLNIGCGKNIKKEFVNLDSVNLPGVDIVHDLNEYPWPFKKDEFDEIYCSHVLEHLDNIIKPLEEIWRITKKNGLIRILVPISPSVWAFADPTHKQFYTYFTFNYFRPEDNLNYYSKARFNIKKRKVSFSKYLRLVEILVNSSEITKKIWAFFLYFLFPAETLEIELKVIK
ncbi:MAG: methyltransferase domain-containing protein [Nanoarchaeota archaeon]